MIASLIVVILCMAIHIWELRLDLRATKMERNRYLGKVIDLRSDKSEDAGSQPDELVTQRSAPSEIAKRAAPGCIHCSITPLMTERGRCEECGKYQTPSGECEQH